MSTEPRSPSTRRILAYTERSIEDDHRTHKDVNAESSDRPAQRPDATFSATPNSGGRPTWAPER
jgi:hypothetical protein